MPTVGFPLKSFFADRPYDEPFLEERVVLYRLNEDWYELNTLELIYQWSFLLNIKK